MKKFLSRISNKLFLKHVNQIIDEVTARTSVYIEAKINEIKQFLRILPVYFTAGPTKTPVVFVHNSYHQRVFLDPSFICSALRDRVGKIEMNISSQSAGMAHVVGTEKGDISIPLTALSYSFDENPELKKLPLSLVKIDVEGYEGEATKGAIDWRNNSVTRTWCDLVLKNIARL